MFIPQEVVLAHTAEATKATKAATLTRVSTVPLFSALTLHFGVVQHQWLSLFLLGSQGFFRQPAVTVDMDTTTYNVR